MFDELLDGIALDSNSDFMAEDGWITIHPNGKGKNADYARIYVDDDGIIQTGAGGKFNGKSLKDAFSKGGLTNTEKTDKIRASEENKTTSQKGDNMTNTSAEKAEEEKVAEIINGIKPVSDKERKREIRRLETRAAKIRDRLPSEEEFVEKETRRLMREDRDIGHSEAESDASRAWRGVQAELRFLSGMVEHLRTGKYTGDFHAWLDDQTMGEEVVKPNAWILRFSTNETTRKEALRQLREGFKYQQYDLDGLNRQLGEGLYSAIDDAWFKRHRKVNK